MDRETRPIPQLIKLWPLLAMQAWQVKASGAYRLWRLAHVAALFGSGRIKKSQLCNFLTELRIPKRTQHRWIKDAIDLGLIIEAADWFYLISLGKCAIKLGCHEIGNPAAVPVKDFITKGWRACVWGAYNVTLSGPMSQKVKEEITGVDPRTQRRYLDQLPVEKNTNYAKRELPADNDYLAGYEEETGRTVFINEQGEVVQKLPDYIVVPETVAQRTPKGRSRKAQKAINATLFQVEQGNRIKATMRLWHKSYKGLEATIKRAADLPLVDQLGDVFLKGSSVARATFWDPEPMFTL